MAVVTLTVASTSDSAVLEMYSGGYTAATANDGFKFVNDGKTRLYMYNGDSGACTILVDVPQPCSYGGTSVHDVSASITNAKDYVIGPFPMHQYNDADGYVTVSLTPAADATQISAKAVKG